MLRKNYQAIILFALVFLFGTFSISAQSDKETSEMINGSYLEAFGRFPSDGEYKSWIQPVKNKIGYNEIIASHLSFMVSSDGENELQQTIIRSYRSAFGREPNRQELTSWVVGIKRKGGLTFANVIEEHIDFMQGNKLNKGFDEMRQTIIRSYLAVFNRQPSIQELNSWMEYMKKNRTQYWQLLVKHAQFLGADRENL